MSDKPYFDSEDVRRNKTLAIVMAVIPLLFFLPMITGAYNTSPYMKYRANQSLVLFITDAILGFAIKIISWIPILGWLASGLLSGVVGLVIFIYWIYGIITVATGSNGKYFIIGEIELLK